MKAQRLNKWFLIASVLLVCMYAPMLFTLTQELDPREPQHSQPLNVSVEEVQGADNLNPMSINDSRVANDVKERTSHGHNLSLQEAELSSSLDYFACCGAGHGLNKLADAFFLAKRLNFGLRAFFGFCGHQEVYSHFFGPQPLSELRSVPLEGLQLKVSNKALGFQPLVRKGPNSTCSCTGDRWKEDQFLYKGLRNRFRAKAHVDHFVQNQLRSDNNTIIGMHVQAGKDGNSTRKQQFISDPKWAESMANLLVEVARDWKHPPVLFLATDAESMVTTFRQLLLGRIEVISATQVRLKQGEVSLGENFDSFGEKCLDGWQAVFADMMILSHAHVVVAARPSSFTQSLPMTLVLSTPTPTRKVPRSYCEVNPSATALQCFETLQDWCCNGVTSFSLEGTQSYDYRRIPTKDLDWNQLEATIAERPIRPSRCIPTPDSPQRTCLPYLMPDKDHVENEGYVDSSVDDDDEYDDDDDSED